MPDEPAGNDVSAQAQEAGAKILAQLDELTQKTASPESPQEYTRRMQAAAQEAMKSIDDIVAEYVVQTRAEQSAQGETDAAAARVSAQEKIDELKKSIGAQ